MVGCPSRSATAMIPARAYRVVATVLLAALSAVFFGAASAPSVAAQKSVITLYTSESEDDVNLVAGDFTRRTPGVEVRIFRAGTGPVEAKIEAERTAGRVRADVIWFADLGFMRDLAGRDMLLPYAPPAARGVPREFQYDGNRMHEVRLIFNVIGINTLAVRFRPASWWDLTQPRYRGRVGLPNPFVSGAAFANVGTFVAMRGFGWPYYQALRRNDTQIIRANGDVLAKLASGEIVVASIVDFFVRHAKAEGSPVDTIWPSEGAVLVPTPVAILRSSAARDAAEAFVNYLYTVPAQRLFVQRSYMPVLPGVPQSAGAPPVSSIKIIQPNLAYIDQHRDELKKMFSGLFDIQ